MRCAKIETISSSSAISIDHFRDNRRQAPPPEPFVPLQPVLDEGNWMNSYAANTSELELDWKKICHGPCFSVGADLQECLIETENGIGTLFYPCCIHSFCLRKLILFFLVPECIVFSREYFGG